MADKNITILGLCGSLRAGSFNRMALKAAGEMVPEGATLETFDEIGDFPLYNLDVQQKGWPPAVQRLCDRMRATDALLIVTPEYNYSVPGLLKNAIDWISRFDNQPFSGKPIAMMGASPGIFGTARAQYQLRQMLVFLNGLPVNKPEVMIGGAASKFTDGKLTDEATRKFVADLLVSLVAWTKRLQASK
jgi:chromate reductase